MMHEWSCSLDDVGKNIKAYTENTDKIFQKWINVYLERSKLNKSTLLSKIKSDWFLTAEETIEWGLADAIYERK